MKFRGMEDRLNPIPPEGADESTVGGYPAVHGRAPAFEGSDGLAYTVAPMIEPADEGEDDWVGYLVFLRWAAEGSAIMGHLETDDVVRGPTREAAAKQLDSLPLSRAKELLEAAIARRREWDSGVNEERADHLDRE